MIGLLRIVILDEGGGRVFVRTAKGAEKASFRDAVVQSSRFGESIWSTAPLELALKL